MEELSLSSRKESQQWQLYRRTVRTAIVSILFAVLQYVETLYIPTGLRTMYTDGIRGAVLTQQLLNGHPERIRNMTRLKKEVFLELLNWLCQKGNLKDSRQVSSAEKLILFLYICAHGIKFRIAAETMQHSTRTIHLAFYEVLHGLLLLHQEVVNLPPDKTPDRIKEDNKFWPYFADCVGALDGTLIEAWVPEKSQARWRSRKGHISQNVLGVCDFEMNFTYVLPGWEGSAHDGRVLGDAKNRGFCAPPGRYYLADSGYTNSSLALTPYAKVRYHLREQARASQRPQNAKELFNLRHASLRNVIERTFGVFKSRFAILQKAPRRYTISTQVHLIFALTAVHNFMNSHGCDPEVETILVETPEEEEDEEDESDNREAVTDHDITTMNERRDGIVNLMWQDYQAYIH
jgi:DDE superfamily endonuclease